MENSGKGIFNNALQKFESETEERLNALVQNGVDLIGILDERALYKYTSPSVKNILGYQENYLIDKSAYEFIHPDDISKIKEQFVRLLEKEEGKLPDFRFKHADGS